MMESLTILRRMLVAILMGVVLTGTAVISHSAQARGVEIVSVQSQGLGITQRDAVLDGVREAVSMVNGMAIASQTSLAELTTEVTTDTDSAFLISSAFMEQVSTATSGIVEGYDILSSSEDTNTGLVIVELSVRVARYRLKNLNIFVNITFMTWKVCERSSTKQFQKIDLARP